MCLECWSENFKIECGWELAECVWDQDNCGWDLAECGSDLAESGWDLAEWLRASACQCQSRNSSGFDPNILRHSGIWGAVDEALLKTVHLKNPKNPPVWTHACMQYVYKSQNLLHLIDGYKKVSHNISIYITSFLYKDKRLKKLNKYTVKFWL